VVGFGRAGVVEREAAVVGGVADVGPAVAMGEDGVVVEGVWEAVGGAVGLALALGVGVRCATSVGVGADRRSPGTHGAWPRPSPSAQSPTTVESVESASRLARGADVAVVSPTTARTLRTAIDPTGGLRRLALC
jgi:hypothetical protein